MVHCRIERVEELVKEALGEILQEAVTDPRLEFVTVSHVRVTKDLRHALVHVSMLSDDEASIRSAMDALAHAKGFLRRELGQAVRLKYLPDLSFAHDSSAAYASHIERILHNIEDESAAVAKQSEEVAEA